MKKLMAICLLASGTAYAGTAFFKYEINDSGMTKQCVYDHIGNTYTITIKSYQLCPLTIQVG
jgi:hypothetical protein